MVGCNSARIAWREGVLPHQRKVYVHFFAAGTPTVTLTLSVPIPALLAEFLHHPQTPSATSRQVPAGTTSIASWHNAASPAESRIALHPASFHFERPPAVCDSR